MFRRRWHVTLACISLCLGSATAAADPPSVPPAAPAQATSAAELLPTVTPTGELPARNALRSPTLADGTLAQRARELDMVLGDAAQDLGLTVRLGNREDVAPIDATESRLVDRAARDGQWQISPRIEELGSMLIVRLVVVPPRSKIALVRVEQVAPGELAVRAVVMLRDLVRAGQGHRPRHADRSPDEASSQAAEPERASRSEGRATLAVNAAILGGFVGYALQKSSGSDDVRLTYPLLALGAGIGVGGSLIVADEWDVRLGDAWYLSGGAVWPTVGGLMLAKGREVEPDSDRWAYGIAGGLGGITLASISLSFGHASDAGAAFVHSGGLLGMGFGGGIELAARGTTSRTPYEGMGYGAISGAVLGGLIGTQAKGSASRVLLVDVGAGLGALSAAAAASPLVFGDRTETRDRLWLAATISGAAAGGVVTYFWTAPSSKPHATTWPSRYGYPTAGVIGESVAPDGTRAPAFGMGWQGRF
ncbi:MAG: hypothetical protein HY898_09855 [Deltaproteobacteria bacterium]|nr:hypothetical protein [Deltaproteobacteria bacterium]